MVEFNNGGVNGFGKKDTSGVDPDKLAKAQERLANFKKENQGLSLFGGGALGFNQPTKGGGGSIFGQQ